MGLKDALVVLASAFILLISQDANGFASFENCGLSAGWVAGRPDNFGSSPHNSAFSAGSSSNCAISINPPGSSYTPGQKFTVTVSSSSNIGFKLENTLGTFSSPSTGGATDTAKCINWDRQRQSTGTATYVAPSAGQVSIRLLCAPSSGSVFVASAITLQPSSPPPATFAPVTSQPTVKGGTRRPTFAQPTSSPVTPPPGISSDPDFDFVLNLDKTPIKLFYRLNDTHVSLKVTQSGAGYLSIGPGTAMIGSTVVVGMDPVANPGNAAVGLYKLVSETGTKSSDIMTSIATTAASLKTFGIVGTSFSTINGQSSLKFAVELANQQPDFTIVNLNGDNINLIYAAGPANANGAFCSQGTCFEHDAFGTVAQVNLALAPGDGAALAGQNKAIELSTDLCIHILTMVAGWGILIPLGIVIPLFNNIKYSPKGSALCGVSGPNWVKYHWVLQSIGLLLTYVGTFTGMNESGDPHWRDLHGRVGLILLIFSIYQPFVAFLRPEKKASIVNGVLGHIKRVIRFTFDYTHLPLGYIMLIVAIVENLIGVNELAVNSTGGFAYVFFGAVGASGFKGPMGVVILILSIFFLGLIAIGLARAAVTKLTHDDNSAFQVLDENGKVVGRSGEAKSIPMGDVGLHNTASSCWVIYNKKVYDITSFLNTHPGGKKVIMPLAGKDITEAYNETGHSAEATAMFTRYYIGELQMQNRRSRSLSQRISQRWQEMMQYMTTNVPEGFNSVRMSISRFHSGVPSQGYYGGRANTNSTVPFGGGGMSVMNPAFVSTRYDFRCLKGNNQERYTVTLTEKFAISPNVYFFKFAFSNPSMVLGLPTGKHIAIFAPTQPGRVKGKWNNAADPEAQKPEIQRKFTPVSCDEVDVGYFSLVVKIYRPCSKYPDGGRMSRYLEGLQVGSKIQIAGPFGSHSYVGKGRMVDNGRELLFNECAMIAGGSGITPVLQIASAMLRDRKDFTRISLLYANSTVDDILMKNQLDELQARYPSRFRVWYTVSEDPRKSGKVRDWGYSVGRLNKKLLADRAPRASSDSIAITCGPKPMMESVNRLLRELGYPEERIVEY